MAAYHAARSSYPPHNYGMPQHQYYAAADNDAPVIPGVTVTRTRSKSDPHRPGSGGRSRSSDKYIVVPPPVPAPVPGPAYTPVHYSTSPPPSYHTSTRQPPTAGAYVYAAAPSPPHGHRQPEYHTSHRPHEPVYAAPHHSHSKHSLPPQPQQPLPPQDKGYRSKNSYTSSGQEVKYVYANGQPAPNPHAYVPKPKRTPVLFWDEKQRRYREGWMEEDEQLLQQQQQQQVPRHHQQQMPLQEEEGEEVDWADRPQTPMTYDQLNKRVYAWLDRAEKEHAAGIGSPPKSKPHGWMDKLKRGAQYHTGIAA